MSNEAHDPQTAAQIKNLGALIEALEIAHQLVQLGPEKTLTAKLQDDLKISKDYYYRRALEFKAITRLDLTVLIDAEILRRTRGVPHPESDFFEWYTAISRLNAAILNPALLSYSRSKSTRPRLRLRVGASEYLSRSLVSPVLRRFRKIKGCSEDEVHVHVELGLSGELYKMFSVEHQLDLYISRTPRQLPETEDLKQFKLPFWLVCPHNHPAAEASRNRPNARDALPLTVLENTTLVLIGPHPQRTVQHVFPREQLREKIPSLQILEVDSFHRAHDLVVCGRTDIATITVPEFVDEERLRGLSLIQLDRFTELTPTDPIDMCLLCRRSDSPEEKAREAAVSNLYDQFAAGILEFSKPPGGIIDWLGSAGHVYYERTKAITPHQSPPSPRKAGTSLSRGCAAQQIAVANIKKRDRSGGTRSG